MSNRLYRQSDNDRITYRQRQHSYVQTLKTGIQTEISRTTGIHTDRQLDRQSDRHTSLYKIKKPQKKSSYLNLRI